MPNWASIEYKIVGKPKQLENLYKRIDKLFGNHVRELWLIKIADKFNIYPPENKHIRGYINVIDYNPGNDYMTIQYDGAWGEQEGFRYILEQKYKGIKIYFYEEEIGNDIYFSNDIEHIFFDFKYIVNLYDFNEYFCDLNETLKFIKQYTGLDDINEENYNELLDEYNKESDEPCYIKEVCYANV